MERLEELNPVKIQLDGLLGSSVSFITRALFKKAERPFLVVLNDKEEAAYYLNDLEQMIGEKDVLFYPGSYRRPYQIEDTDNANVLLRAEVLNRINSRKKPAVIVSYPEALFEKEKTSTIPPRTENSPGSVIKSTLLNSYSNNTSLMKSIEILSPTETFKVFFSKSLRVTTFSNSASG